MRSDRLKEAPSEVRDVFARAGAALDGLEATGEMTEDAKDALADMLVLRHELGWDQE